MINTIVNSRILIVNSLPELPTIASIMPDVSDFGYVAVGVDGVRHWGETASEARQAFYEELHQSARSAHDSGFSIAELREQRAMARDYEDMRESGRPA